MSNQNQDIYMYIKKNDLIDYLVNENYGINKLITKYTILSKTIGN